MCVYVYMHLLTSVCLPVFICLHLSVVIYLFLKTMRAWGRLFNAASPQFIQRLQRLQDTSKTHNDVILLFDFFNRYPGLRRLVGSILLMYVQGCPGYVRTNMFTNRCNFCGVPSSEHPAVEFKKRTPTISMISSAKILLRLDRSYYRWSTDMRFLFIKRLQPALELVKQSWVYVSLDVHLKRWHLRFVLSIVSMI